MQDGIRTADYGFVATGYDAKTQGPVLIKFDGGGNISWSRGYDSLNFSRSLIRTTYGNFLVAATGLFKSYLLKYNPVGELVWAKEMMDPTGANFRVETIKELAGGDLGKKVSCLAHAGFKIVAKGWRWNPEANEAAGKCSYLDLPVSAGR